MPSAQYIDGRWKLVASGKYLHVDAAVVSMLPSEVTNRGSSRPMDVRTIHACFGAQPEQLELMSRTVADRSFAIGPMRVRSPNYGDSVVSLNSDGTVTKYMGS